MPVLLDAGHEVRCLVRTPEKLNRALWRDRVEVFRGDVFDPDSLDSALEGCDSAFYLIHSMEDGGHDFSDRDRVAARNFSMAAERAELERIVYLGGLGAGASMSKHLTSRQEVGRILAGGATPVTELRAAVIIGSGSVSFEMLRYLTEVLPVMVTPSWVRTKCQPIAVDDVLQILADAIEERGEASHVREIGGPDTLTYEEMMRVYAEEAGLPRRWIIPIPLLSPRLSSHWVGLVTPLPTAVAKPLVESLRVEVVVSGQSDEEFPAGQRITYRDAVRRALRGFSDDSVATRWSDASTNPAHALPSDPVWSGGTVMTDRRLAETTAQPEDLFWAFSRIGGSVGYYAMDWAWELRGLVDKLVGGVGLRRGRRHAEETSAGEALDFWRVTKIEDGTSLQLYAEMKLPGEAWLSFEALPTDSGSRLVQTAVFVPRGLLGRLYWLALTPLHAAIFSRMARRIAAAAEARAAGVGVAA